MSFVGVEEALSKKGDQLISAVIDSQQRKGLRASGQSAASLHKRITKSGTVWTLDILGRAYFFQQQNGRRPSSKKPSRAMVQSIEEWTKVRGISIPAYAIATKIQRDGIKVPNPFNPGGVLSEPLNTDNVISSLKASVRAILIEEAKSTFFK